MKKFWGNKTIREKDLLPQNKSSTFILYIQLQTSWSIAIHLQKYWKYKNIILHTLKLHCVYIYYCARGQRYNFRYTFIFTFLFYFYCTCNFLFYIIFVYIFVLCFTFQLCSHNNWSPPDKIILCNCQLRRAQPAVVQHNMYIHSY